MYIRYLRRCIRSCILGSVVMTCDFLKSQQGKSAKKRQIAEKGAIIHKIPEFVGGTADFRRRSFHLKGNTKRK